MLVSGRQKSLPRITIVTPTLNQGAFIEQTIRSVLDQNYPNLEFMILDGVSTDNTLDIVRRYESRLSYWSSERDTGQTNAINKGFARSTGELFNWLNSDDRLLPGALWKIAEAWNREKVDFVVGSAEFFDYATGQVTRRWPALPAVEASDFIPPQRVFMAQPSTFIGRRIIEELGGFDDSLRCVMDYEFYFRATIAQGKLRARRIEETLSRILWHPNAKTFAIPDVFVEEWGRVMVSRYFDMTPACRLKLTAHLTSREQIARVAAASTTLELMTLASQDPSILSKRFWWGGVRKKMTPKLI